jgi:hypothetical protein
MTIITINKSTAVNNINIKRNNNFNLHMITDRGKKCIIIKAAITKHNKNKE